MGLFTKSVDSIVADITRKVQQLEAAVSHHNTQSDAHHASALASDELALAHASEAERANSIATKLTALIS